MPFRLEVPDPEYVDTDEKARELLYLSLNKVREEPNDYIGFDTETHAKTIHMPSKSGKGGRKPLDWMSDTITFWSLAFKVNGHYRRWCIDQEYFVYFSPLLENPEALIAIHNAKYDAHISWNCGLNIWNSRVHDSLVMSHLHDENKRDHGLKTLMVDWCGYQMQSFKSLFKGCTDREGKPAVEYVTPLYDLPRDDVMDYASYDAFGHSIMAEWLRDRLRNTPINTQGYDLYTYFCDMEVPFTELLWRMERRGLPFDTEYMSKNIPIIDERIRELEFDINRGAGMPVNVNAPKQLAKLFFSEEGLNLKPIKMTPGGAKGPQPSTDEEVMNVLAEAGIEVAQLVVKLRSLKKTKSTYMTTLLDMCAHFEDSRIHPSFNQMGAGTGRLSTTAPNSQNFPTAATDDWGIRKAFIAPPGFKLIVSDYDQLEMKIMADRSKDTNMVQAILDGKDLHCFTVSKMDDSIEYDAVVAAKKTASKDRDEHQVYLIGIRQDFKAVGFGLIYGAGAASTSERIDISDEEVAQRLIDLRRDPNYDLDYKLRRMKKKNPLFSKEKALVRIARESITQDKIDDYFEVFPGVKKYMDNVPAECRYTKEYDFYGKPKHRPLGSDGAPIDDGAEYDWDFGWHWNPGSRQLTRTGHEKRFGFVQTLCGRYRRLEDIDHKNFWFKSKAERQGTNVTIQGSAADITKAAMLRIEKHPVLNALNCLIINQIHDEIVSLIPEENAEKAMPYYEECMVHPFNEGEDCLSVPLTAGVKVVDRWAEAKD